MKKSFSLILCTVLLMVTCVFAVLHLQSQTSVAEQMLLIRSETREITPDLSEVQKSGINGKVVNGKGDTLVIDETGYLLIDLLRCVGIDPEKVSAVTVTAEDCYSAGVRGEELSNDNVYLAVTENNGFQLIVFGDKNSKRNVKNVKTIDVEEK